MSSYPIDRLRSIRTLPMLVAYLRDELDWPIDADNIEDMFFDYEAEELGLKQGEAVHIKEIKQLRPLDTKQEPWGIFWVNFEKKRLPVVLLRRIIGHLVIKKRASASKAQQRTWHLNDLLFMSCYGEDEDSRAITFAHFSQDIESPSDLPTLKVLGWDGADTVLHLADAHRSLTTNLRWPDDPDDVDAWREQWRSAFTLRHREVITTTQQLVSELADLAVQIRKRVDTILPRESEKGPLRRLFAAFQATLIHDLTEDDFADVIAQTVTYGLLAAKFSQPAGISVANLVEMVPPTNPFLRELLGTFLTLAGRKGVFDFDELGFQDVVDLLNAANTDAVKSDFGNKTRQEDPIIHFYEHFLKAYDHEKKVRRGVFYTPQPVVSYIVRSVHELLQTEFGLEDGLASTVTWGEMAKRNKDLKIPDGAKPSDPFVLILDPATGTATFLVEVIEVIFTHLKKKWTDLGKKPAEISKAWNEYVPKALLPRLYGYELMMAPYTIAHMKLGLKLSEINTRLGQPDYQFKFKDRAHIYLTNSLEPAGDDKEQAEFESFFPALAHEAAAVGEVKRHKRFTVIIGNPPYAGHSSNFGEWITRLVDEYYFVDGRPLGERNPKWLQDDYVKFIRLGQEVLHQAGNGVFSFITNHGYIDNPTFRGMRQSILRDFNRSYVCDLHGNMKKKERSPDGSPDENVFDIQQGVAIFVAVSCPGESNGVKKIDVFGNREHKYSVLLRDSVASLSWHDANPSSPFYFFLAQDQDIREEYLQYQSIKQVMRVNVLGFQTHRDHFAIAFDEQAVSSRFDTFRATKLTDSEIKDRFGLSDRGGWSVRDARRMIRSDKGWRENIIHCLYRPFDVRWCYFGKVAMDRPRRELQDHVLHRSNLCLLVPRQISFLPWRHVSVSDTVAESCVVSTKTKEGNYNFPLYLYPERDSLSFESGTQLNFADQFLGSLAFMTRLKRVEPWDLPKGLEPEDILHYIYAIFHSATYRGRYAEFLKSDFPRLPLPPDLNLFRSLAELGGKLVALHLMKSPRIDKRITKWVGAKNPEVGQVSYSQGTVWIDKGKTLGFEGVPEQVWDFHIGGHQVCEKWLKDRGPKKGNPGRTLTAEDIDHYQKIVVALNETMRLMAEIDKVIEKNGGWPGAFVTEKADERTITKKPKQKKRRKKKG